jgi:transposase-like protein
VIFDSPFSKLASELPMEGGSISRRKSYTAQFKLEVIEVATEKGNREAGRQFNVGESSVREWRMAETFLKSLHKRKRAMRSRRCLWPTIEKKLYDWVVNERAKGMRTPTVRVLQESKRIAQEDNIKDFKAYPSWVLGFMKRNSLNAIDFFSVESDEEFLGFE